MAFDKDQIDCVLQLQPELDNFITWAHDWKILVNPIKTKVMTFGRTNNDVVTLTLNGEPIMEVSNHKHLGVYLQEDLKWSKQVDNMIANAEQRLSVLKKYHRFNVGSVTL